MAEITRVLIALIVRVGVDLAKNVIQVHAVDASGRRVVARGPGWLKCTAYRRPGPRDTPLGLGLNEGLGTTRHGGRGHGGFELPQLS